MENKYYYHPVFTQKHSYLTFNSTLIFTSVEEAKQHAKEIIEDSDVFDDYYVGSLEVYV